MVVADTKFPRMCEAGDCERMTGGKKPGTKARLKCSSATAAACGSAARRRDRRSPIALTSSTTLVVASGFVDDE